MFSYSFWSRTLLYNQVLILCVLYILTFIHHFVQNIYNYKIYPGLYLEQISSGTIYIIIGQSMTQVQGCTFLAIHGPVKYAGQKAFASIYTEIKPKVQVCTNIEL